MHLITFSLLFLFYLEWKNFIAQPQLIAPRQNIPYFQTPLDSHDKFHLFWTLQYESKSVNFELRLKLTDPNQWFAFGFSDYGKLSESDFCILWFDSKSQFHFQDTWTDSNGFVNLDSKNDCHLVRQKKQGKLLRLLFQRTLDTCDQHDKAIEDGTSHIVWATGPGPLKHVYGLNLDDYEHGFQRVTLLKTLELPPPLPQDTQILDVHNEQVPVPNVKTTYWCKLTKLPDKLAHKHHVIRYQANVEPENAALVHHMEVFHCQLDPKIQLPQWNGPCDDPKKPKILEACKRVISAWAMGAQPFSYPEEAGVPIGGQNFSLYAVLEVHYNNPQRISDVIDSSGIKIFYTPTLRKFDVGVLEVGLEYGPKNSIPPNQENFHLSGYCVAECTRVGLPPNGITVFASQLHTHLTGVRVWTRHIRGGIELPELNRDNHYSPHFQEIRMLKRRIKVLPGDVLINTCRYRTLNRSLITLGGFGISEEMCVNYIHYYPRSELEVCKSSIDSLTLKEYFEYLRIFDGEKTSKKNSVSRNYNSIKWTLNQSKKLNVLYQTSPLSMQCNQSSGDRFPGYWEGVPLPEIRVPLVKHRECENILSSHQDSVQSK